jgi:hypothetical protein
VRSWIAALAISLVVDAPPSLSRAAARVRAIDQQRLADGLARAGLELPAEIHVTLLEEGGAQARGTPAWIVARAFGSREILIFPARATGYPYDSLESVMQHEVVHLALNARAGGRPLPRWFHEGVATSVESGWDLTDRVRLLAASLRDPEIAEVSRLFRSDRQPDTTLAYLLAAVLLDDLRGRHGATLPGRVAARVSGGVPFERAFVLETGETPEVAASRAWAAYRRWTNWLPALTGGSSLWAAIVLLACAAFVAARRRRAQRRRQWDEEDGSPAGPEGQRERHEG